MSIKINAKTAELLKCCAHTGLADETDAIKKLGITPDELGLLLNQKYISKHRTVSKGALIIVYRLDKKGVKWIFNYTNISYLYRWNSKHVNHDLLLSGFYCSIPKELRDTWKNEHQIIRSVSNNIYRSKIHKGFIDAIISDNDNILIAIEAVTANYSKQEIANKKEFAKLLGCKKFKEIKQSKEAQSFE